MKSTKTGFEGLLNLGKCSEKGKAAAITTESRTELYLKNALIKFHLWKLVFPFTGCPLQREEIPHFWRKKKNDSLQMCVKSKHLPLLHALKFPFLVHLYAAFLFDQVVQRTWAVPERHLLVRIFHHPENMANMFLITYLKNKAVSLYCTGEEHIHLNLNCSLCPFQANSKRVFTPVKPALKSILFYFVNSSDFDFHTNTIIVLTSQTYFRDFFSSKVV